MAKRPPHRLPYATHQWVGELLFQSRNTLVHASVVMGNSSVFHKVMPRCTSIVHRLDKLRSKLDDALFAEHAHGPYDIDKALLRVYYPQSALWLEQGPSHPPKTVHHTYRRKWLLTWQDHLTLGEWLWQSWDLAYEAWRLLLPAYGASDPNNRLLETLVPSATAFTQVHLWCQDRMHDAIRQGLLQWPPDENPNVYIHGAQFFTPWAHRFAPTATEISV